jgi:hypothetical protein
MIMLFKPVRFLELGAVVAELVFGNEVAIEQ